MEDTKLTRTFNLFRFSCGKTSRNDVSVLHQRLYSFAAVGLFGFASKRSGQSALSMTIIEDNKIVVKMKPCLFRDVRLLLSSSEIIKIQILYII